MIYTGRKISIGLGKETTRGEAVDPSLYYAHIDFSGNDKVEYKENESSLGILAKNFEKDVVQKYAELSIKGILGAETSGYFLLAMLGSVSDEDLGDGAYKHTFNLLNDNLHPTFTIVEKNGVEGLAYPLAGIESLSLSFEEKDYIYLESSWKANMSETKALTPTYQEETKFKSRQIEIFIADDIAGLDSATAICVESGNLELTKEIEQIFCLGKVSADDIISKVIDLQLNLVVKHTDTTFSEYQKNGTLKAVRLKITDTSTTIGTSDKNPTLQIDIPKVSFDEVSKEGGKDDIIKQNLTLSGLYDLTEAKLLNTELTNGTNTY